VWSKRRLCEFSKWRMSSWNHIIVHAKIEFEGGEKLSDHYIFCWRLFINLSISRKAHSMSFCRHHLLIRCNFLHTLGANIVYTYTPFGYDQVAYEHIAWQIPVYYGKMTLDGTEVAPYLLLLSGVTDRLHYCYMMRDRSLTLPVHETDKCR
jgi:hypothetical protein